MTSPVYKIKPAGRDSTSYEGTRYKNQYAPTYQIILLRKDSRNSAKILWKIIGEMKKS